MWGYILWGMEVVGGYKPANEYAAKATVISPDIFGFFQSEL